MSVSPPPNQPPRALILGGGLAGLAAALRLREAGLHITLVEAKNRLGGRATSFTDPKSGETLDNCQHILLRCCTNLIDFYRRLGVLNQIAWHDTLYFASRRNNTPHIDILKQNSLLPAPLHLALSFLKFRALSIPDKLALARALRALISVDRNTLDNISFYEFLKQQEQPETLIKRFWEVIITSACNGSVRKVSASAAAQVFQLGFLGNRDAYAMGIPTGPLRNLYDPALNIINDLKLRKRALSINLNDNSPPNITSVSLSDGSTLRDFDLLILALPQNRISSLFTAIPDSLHLPFLHAAQLQTSPILSIHLWFHTPVTHLPHTAFLDHDIHWVFFNNQGKYAHIVISAADKWIPLSQEETLTRALADLRSAFPEATPANLKSSQIIKEKNATFLPAPRSDGLRPGNTTPITNLFLAGDYTKTTWPATMEGAVRSGYLAANAAIQFINKTAPSYDSPTPHIQPFTPPPDLKPSPLYTLLRNIPVI